MGTEVAAPEPSSTPKLPLFSIIPPMQSSPERSGMLTPPLQTSASVPFRWEEEPGKPRPCTALITTTTTLSHQNGSNTNNFCLELPPRLQLMDSSSFKMTKMPSPTTVLDGPYLPIVSSSSFRFGRERQGSFGNNSSCGSPERGQLGAMVLSNRRTESSKERRGGLFGSWGGKSKPKPTTLTLTSRGTSTKKEVGGGSFVFSSSMDLEDYFCGGGGGGGSSSSGEEFRVKKQKSRIRRNGSFSSLSQVRSHFWGTIYEGFKQVLPWKSRKPKKDGFIN